MGMTSADYLQHLQALLPQGPAWPRDADADLTKLLTALADEFSRLDAKAERVIDEEDARSTSELLADWERVAGLPDVCTGALSTISARRSALVARLTNLGGQSRQFYIAIAAALGYAITISEFRPYQVNSKVNDPLCGVQWIFVWQVNAAQNTVRRFAVNSQVSESLASWGNILLECAISRLKPAHTKVQFAYT